MEPEIETVFYVKMEMPNGAYGKLDAVFKSKLGAQISACKRIVDHFRPICLETTASDVPLEIIDICNNAFEEKRYDDCINTWNEAVKKFNRLFTFKVKMVSFYP